MNNIAWRSNICNLQSITSGLRSEGELHSSEALQYQRGEIWTDACPHDPALSLAIVEEPSCLREQFMIWEREIVVDVGAHGDVKPSAARQTTRPPTRRQPTRAARVSHTGSYRGNRDGRMAALLGERGCAGVQRRGFGRRLGRERRHRVRGGGWEREARDGDVIAVRCVLLC